MGDGNINFVYIVEGPKGGLVLKQGLPYIRIAPDWPLTQVRIQVICLHPVLRKRVPEQQAGRPSSARPTVCAP